MGYGELELDLAGVPAGSRLYMGLSGGLDSAYHGWRLLRAGYRLVIHHCSLKALGNRRAEEDAATAAVLDWYRDQGLDDFDYLETAIDVQRGVPFRVIDQEAILWVASLHLRPYTGKRTDVDTRQDVVGIVIPNYHTSGVVFGERRFDGAWAMFELMVGRKVKPLMPFYDYPKARVLQDMPPELFAMCWWCRNPKDGVPCGRCKQCRNVAASGRFNG